ncbi:MAG: nitroreductase family protein [Christensenellaceae bacterium]
MISCVMNRRSVRAYTGEKIPDELVHQLLQAGMVAPSAHNSRPYEFIVVRDKTLLKKLADIRVYWKMLTHADLAIVVVANLTDYKSSITDFFVQDCAAATQNILVAAEGLSLGGVWLGCYPTKDGMSGVRNALHIPNEIVPFSIISLGIPAEHPHPHTSFDDFRIHCDTY